MVIKRWRQLPLAKVEACEAPTLAIKIATTKIIIAIFAIFSSVNYIKNLNCYLIKTKDLKM